MPECHNCKWNAEPPTAEKTAACTTCRLPPYRINHKGKVWVSIDAHGATADNRDAQTLAEVEASLQSRKADADAEAEGAEPLADCCRQTALALLDFMRGLNEREIKVLVEVAHGANLAEVARGGVLERRGRGGRVVEGPMTRANVSFIWRRILRKFPDLATVLNGARKPRKAGPT